MTDDKAMQGFAFPVVVIRTNRKKSASICIDGEQVKVSVPKFLSEIRVRELIHKRTPWIVRKRKEQFHKPVARPLAYVSGERLPYLGRYYRLMIMEADSPTIKMKNGCLEARIHRDEIDAQAKVKALLGEWYRCHAEQYLREKTASYALSIGVWAKSVTVRKYKSRWGSCTRDGAITYNWQIILAPHQIVDYVVVHELCHLLEHNHSPQFWQHVARHVPDWQACREWLRVQNPVL